MYFREFITLGIVQQHDYPVFVTEEGERGIKPLDLFTALIIPGRVVGPGQAGEPFTRQFAFLDGVHAPASETAAFVDKKVVHNPAQPGPGRVDFHEVVELGVCLDEEFLEKILSFGLLPGQSPSEAVQPVKVWSYEFFERIGRLVYGVSPFLMNT